MSEVSIYIVILVSTVILLNSNVSFGSKNIIGAKEKNILVIEHLTKYATKQKNYRREPKNFQSFGYLVFGKVVGEDAFFEYTFPLVDSHESLFRIKLNASNVSSTVNQFGCKTTCFARSGESEYAVQTNDLDFLHSNMNKDGFYFYGFEKRGYGINHNHIIDISKELTSRIAAFIVDELTKKQKDNYENRVRSALHFVQFLPYGVPDFDHADDCYFELALPHESFVLSYSDCDSKSTLFAGILHHLIDPENIILVGCVIDGGGHMITGVSGLYYPGQYYSFQDKKYLLIETTTPIPLELQPSNRFQEIEIHPVIQR
jgi:hypothetical protein